MSYVIDRPRVYTTKERRMLDERYPRLFAQLMRQHTPANAYHLLLGCRRGDEFSRAWVGMCFRARARKLH